MRETEREGGREREGERETEGGRKEERVREREKVGDRERGGENGRQREGERGTQCRFNGPPAYSANCFMFLCFETPICPCTVDLRVWSSTTLQVEQRFPSQYMC